MNNTCTRNNSVFKLNQSYKEPEDGKFMDATSEILDQLWSPSNDEELKYSDSSEESSAEESAEEATGAAEEC